MSVVASALRQPSREDAAEWRAYWASRGQPWRSEPEIDAPRQHALGERRQVAADPARGTYPFQAFALTRADIEWLLSTHTSQGVEGPVLYDDPQHQLRDGVDLRGADLRGLDLSGLPLARLRGGLAIEDRFPLTEREGLAAAAMLDDAILQDAHLEGACLRGAHLTRTNLRGVHLEHADLMLAHMQDARLLGAHLERAHLLGAHLEGANLFEADVSGADLRLVYFDQGTSLNRVHLANGHDGTARLADVRWNGANLAVVQWDQGQQRRRRSLFSGTPVLILGDERVAGERRDRFGLEKTRARRLAQREAAVRANRQLAAALRGQGLNEEGDRFAYRAQVLQRRVLWRRGQLGTWLFSLFLGAVAGHGYKPGRTALVYLLVLSAFTAAYVGVANVLDPRLATVAWYEWPALSISAFHGRGFFPGTLPQPPSVYLLVLALAEAIIGLFIELTFIATFSRRFLGT